jgi:hypothetical protein
LQGIPVAGWRRTGEEQTEGGGSQIE